MNTSILKGIAAWMIMLAIASLASCTSGSEEIPDVPASNQTPASSATGEKQFSFRVALVDGEGRDITTKNIIETISLFIFDENDRFYTHTDIDARHITERREINMECPGNDRITVIAWGGISADSETVTHLTKGSSSRQDFLLSLNHEEGIACPTHDLFYGQQSITATSQSKSSAADEVVMECKAASISLTTGGIAFNENDIFSYKIKNIKSAFNYKGEPIGETIEYIIPATIDKKGNITVSKASVFPSSEITIELYKNDERVFSAGKDGNNKNLAAQPGKLVEVTFDYTSTLSVQTVIVPWNVVFQNINIGG